jgi:phosphoribosylcarboxyaminoimidazole (NCAIR) mutase
MNSENPIVSIIMGSKSDWETRNVKNIFVKP